MRLEGLVHKAVLFHHWDPFKRLARNGDGIERPAATYDQKTVNIKGPRIRAAASWVAHPKRPVRVARRFENALTACRKLLVRSHQASRVVPLLSSPPPENMTVTVMG